MFPEVGNMSFYVFVGAPPGPDPHRAPPGPRAPQGPIPAGPHQGPGEGPGEGPGPRGELRGGPTGAQSPMRAPDDSFWWGERLRTSKMRLLNYNKCVYNMRL